MSGNVLPTWIISLCDSLNRRERSRGRRAVRTEFHEKDGTTLVNTRKETDEGQWLTSHRATNAIQGSIENVSVDANSIENAGGVNHGYVGS